MGLTIKDVDGLILISLNLALDNEPIPCCFLFHPLILLFLEPGGKTVPKLRAFNLWLNPSKRLCSPTALQQVLFTFV